MSHVVALAVSPSPLRSCKKKRFGDNVEYVHCINMLPFTPITEDLLHRDFMEQEWPVLETAFDGRDPGMRDDAVRTHMGCVHFVVLAALV